VETDRLTAPPVVAVVVVHEPDERFDVVLGALGAQDYPALRFLFLVDDRSVAADPDLAERITARIPGAFVRPVDTTIGFGATANEVLRFVEGDNGLFLICHDDVAPEPGAVRALVEELIRSNAGAVGPKLVTWDDPRVLQSVGLGLDRFGEIDRVVDDGEIDQEQHDGVRDVFVVPSAFMLIRADLFRSIGGFDPAITFHGDDVELCWRVHYSGARVLVVPSACVRHAGALERRRPDLHHEVLRARHRLRAVATLTAASRLLIRMLELVVLTLVELVVGLFTGTFAAAWASLRGLVGLVPRIPSLVRRRRAVAPFRSVPEREVLGLQERGSARLNAFIRSRETATYVRSGRGVRRWRESTTAPVVAWIVVLAVVLLASRDFIRSGVPQVGEFLAFPASPRSVFETYMSGFNPTGAGGTSPNPTGWGLLALASFVTLFRMALLQTVIVIGLVVVGAIGLWKLVTILPSTRARIASLLIYAASPLVAGAMSSGQLTTLVAYAATPWIVFTLCRAVGVSTADPGEADDDLADAVIELTSAERARRGLVCALVIATAAAWAPIVLPVALILTVCIAVGTALALAGARLAGWFLVTGAAATVAAAVLNMPWIGSWTWSGLTDAEPVGAAGLGLWTIASFDIGNGELAWMSLALYLPVVAAVLLARAWRLTWAVRSGVLVVVFGGLAVLADADALPFSMPEAGVLLAPVAVALAIAGGAALAAFDLDVRGGAFGWRQPLGLLAGVAVAFGVVPGVAAVGSGDWNTPTTPFPTLLDAFLPGPTDAGDYNVLFVGDARLLPVPATAYRDGTSWAITDDDPLGVQDRWMPPANGATDAIETALDRLATSSTLRVGQLLAPLGIRFVVVPRFDGVASTPEDPLPLPAGLMESLDDQLDVSSVTSLPTLLVYENRAWIPSQAMLTGATAEASRSAGDQSLVTADLSAATPVFVGADALVESTDDVTTGVVSLAVPFDPNWELRVDGAAVPSRRSFGEVTGFDVAGGGVAALSYATPISRPLLVLLQTLLWAVALLAVSRLRLRFERREQREIVDETLIDLGPNTPIDVLLAGSRPTAGPGDDGAGDAGAGDDGAGDDGAGDEVDGTIGARP
jgi:GT2 family glycosyltransferase